MFLEPSVLEWLSDATKYLNEREAERVLRVSFPDSRVPFVAYWNATTVDEKVEFLDYVLHVLHTQDGASWIRTAGPSRRVPASFVSPQRVLLHELELILSQGGSIWRVVSEPFWSLERRAGETTRDLVDLVASNGSDAGLALASAWHSCYRPSPDYSKAYADAVTAVEACLLPAATPDDQTATFGKALSHVRDTQARWTVGSLKGARHSGETLVAMLQTLWQGQQRHAQPDGTIIGVTQTEAEAAVSLAVTLVHWFSAGLVVKGNK